MASLNVHDNFIRQAVALAAQARENGNHPFGALLVYGLTWRRSRSACR